MHSRILLLSLRNIAHHVSRSAIVEFEDVISSMDGVDMITPVTLPGSPPGIMQRTYGFLHRHAFGPSRKNRPALSRTVLERDYDLFFFFAHNVEDLVLLSSIPNWRARCARAVCWVHELWPPFVERFPEALAPLSEFDHIIFSLYNAVNGAHRLLGRDCRAMPNGVDTIRFCPYPRNPRREVDVYSIGRRSPVVHNALLDWRERSGIHYVYDTATNYDVTVQAQHRTLVANMLKRSRYFLVAMSKFQAQAETGCAEEFGCRYIEGAAAGAVLLGDHPKTEYFFEHLGWQDAVIPIPDDGAGIAPVILDLDMQPDRLNRIRTANVLHSLQRHDWVYRWEKVLEMAGLPATPEMLARRAQLNMLADMVSDDPSRRPAFAAQTDRYGQRS